MEKKVYEGEEKGHKTLVQEKLDLYKKTLELVKSGDVFEEVIQMRSQFQDLQEEVASLRKEIEEIKRAKSIVNVEESEVITDEVVESEPLTFKKLSDLLKSASHLDISEREDEESRKKSRRYFKGEGL